MVESWLHNLRSSRIVVVVSIITFFINGGIVITVRIRVVTEFQNAVTAGIGDERF
jgi:hypothetical protein